MRSLACSEGRRDVDDNDGGRCFACDAGIEARLIFIQARVEADILFVRVVFGS